MTRKMMMIKKTLMLVLMLTFGTTASWGATVKVTYHIINLGRLGDNGQLTISTRTEALKFDVTGDNTVTVGIQESAGKELEVL